MPPVTFEQGIAIEKLSENTFRSTQTPWTWPNSTVVPGGILMALAANAAYATTSQGFDLDTLSCHFVSAPKSDVLFDINVQKLSDSGRFCSRVATLSQKNVLMVHVTCSFLRTKAMTGASMEHSVQRRSRQKINEITLDDLGVKRTDLGPYMRFQRLPLLPLTPQPNSPPAPESLLYTSAAQVSPVSTNPQDQRNQHLRHLAIIALSDYHILDCPPTAHGLSSGTPSINDTIRSPATIRPSDFTFLTSLNHSIRFHNLANNSFSGDEMVYVEAWCPWTAGRRGQVESRVFSSEGVLLASCVQEAYFVMKEGEEAEKARESGRAWVMESDDGRGRSKL